MLGFRQNAVLLVRAGSVAVFACCLFGCTGCKEGEGVNTVCESEASRTSVAAAFRAEAIVRVGSALQAAEALSRALDAHAAAPSERTLVDARDRHLVARRALVAAGPYLYGPLGGDDATEQLETFPADTTLVSGFLRGDAGYDPASPPTSDRGFAAIEFALFRHADTLSLASAGAEYLRRQGELAVAQLTTLDTDWREAEAFSIDEGTSAGSAFSVVVNSVSRQLEDARRERLGEPFGIATLEIPVPQAVEAPYSRQSTELLLESISASRRALTAESAPSARGLLAYLEEHRNPEARALATDIEAAYAELVDAVLAIPGPIAQAVIDERAAVQRAYAAFSRQVINLKTDLPAVTCVAITYVDNPSDSD